MDRNVGGLDRAVRLVGGVALLALGVAAYTGAVRVAVGPMPQALAAGLIALLGLILLVTGLTRLCAVNRLLGRNTAGR